MVQDSVEECIDPVHSTPIMERDTATPSTSAGSAECSRKTSAELEQIRTVSTTETGVVAGHLDSEAMASLAHTTSQQEMRTSIEAHTWRWPRTFAANMALVACACQMGVSWGHVNVRPTHVGWAGIVR